MSNKKIKPEYYPPANLWEPLKEGYVRIKHCGYGILGLNYKTGGSSHIDLKDVIDILITSENKPKRGVHISIFMKARDTIKTIMRVSESSKLVREWMKNHR